MEWHRIIQCVGFKIQSDGLTGLLFSSLNAVEQVSQCPNYMKQPTDYVVNLTFNRCDLVTYIDLPYFLSPNMPEGAVHPADVVLVMNP